MSKKKYKVWWPDRNQKREHANYFDATDHEHAAELWADWYDGYSADYCIVNGESADVLVASDDEGTPTAVSVTGAAVREYTGTVTRAS